ncbi:hypothetical protein [Paenibacillus polymyxa]|uniref:hypothetical protein n=1 Tax=Paenibacillus polymyxa TaxID=1406 RepID=UPI0012DAAD12|nr:hypothetical protein [Paenibacillus polymyxa]
MWVRKSTEDVFIEGAPALLNNSTLICCCQGIHETISSFFGGGSTDNFATGSGGEAIISITDDGQDG